MATFAKPENALKRAEELVNVGQKQAALQALHDLITSKRYRAWQKTLERIMFKYVELCVDMRRGRFAKDGLIQYRIVCQQVNVNSLEEVIKYFLQLSTEKAEQAQAQVQAAEVALDVEDLEAEKRPEDLMLSYVSGEKGKARSDRELVTPWFKFLWETYRTVLEILRNNSKLEALYAMTAHRAFQFCLQYKRKTEFRRLCEIIRNHLVNLNKYRDQRDRPDLSLPESLQLYLDTRFEQLKVATELELWQEAFRSIEDIHGLMCMVKKTPKPQLLAIYYSKLIKIFWTSKSHLNHAYAWFKLYSLQKSFNKNLTQKDLQLIASSVLLAAISVMPYDYKHGASHYELDNEKEKSLKMANLMSFSTDSKKDTKEVLSRTALISDLVSKGVMTYVPQEVKDLYHLLENEFHPLDLSAKVLPLLDKLSQISDKLSSASPIPEVQLDQYIPALKKLTALRVLQQASQVYQTMKISVLTRMIPFFSFTTVEKICSEAVEYNFVHIKIFNLYDYVQFGSQDLETDKMKNHLTVLAKRLNKARSLIYPLPDKATKVIEPAALLGQIEKEHKKLLARKVLIEKRKEEQERQILEMEREEETKRLKLQMITEEAEQKRLQIEARRREEMRIRREIEEKELQEVQNLIQETERRKSKKGKKPIIDTEKAITKQDVLEQVLIEQLKERQELERKLQKLGKTMDYLERAKREEEAPLIEAAYQKRLVDDKLFHEQQQQQAVEQSKLEHSENLMKRNRLMRMFPDKSVFEEGVVSRRKGEFERLKRERELRLAELRAIRKQNRDRERKMEYYRRQQEERLTKIKEEEEARKWEEAERKRKEEAEYKAKLDEMAEKQKQREREIEERMRQEKEKLRQENEAALREEPKVAPKPVVESKPDRFVPRHLRQPAASPAASAAASEADGDNWRRPADRPARVDDRKPFLRDRQSDGPSLSDRYAPPRGGRYEPPRGGGGGHDSFRTGRDRDPPGGRGLDRPRTFGDRWGAGPDSRDRNRDEGSWKKPAPKAEQPAP